MTSRFEEINLLLKLFDGYQAIVDSKKLVVKDFLKTLKLKMIKRKSFIIKDSKFYKIGSSYEDTAVSPKADFDIAMVLPPPFVMDFFECEEVLVGVYKLRCTDDSEYLDKFINSKGFLKVEELRKVIFKELSIVIDDMETEGYAVKYHELYSSLTLTFTKAHESVKMDIAPQFRANIGDVPGWTDAKNIPKPMKDYIDDNDVHILLNLSYPIDLQDERFSSLVVQPAFNLLEKECMLNSDIARDAVRIAKSVCKKYNWMKDGLRSFQIKRIALILFDQIENSNDPWNGYKMIMNSLIDMLIRNGKIDGFLIKEQNIICKDESECKKLGVKIRTVVRNIQPNNILKCLRF